MKILIKMGFLFLLSKIYSERLKMFKKYFF